MVNGFICVSAWVGFKVIGIYGFLRLKVKRAGKKICGIYWQFRTKACSFKCLEKTGEDMSLASHPEDTQSEQLLILDLDSDDDPDF